MNTDFTPNNVEIWIDNWKRENIIGPICAKWLETFPFVKINVIVNHTNVTINNFPETIRDKIKLWPNVMRHNNSRGPISRNINQAYIHTFLDKKKYCIVAHDSYLPNPGWVDCVKNTNYQFYSAPQGDGFHIMTMDGLRTFGWWDERYATMGWHEIDYLARVLKYERDNNTKFASIVDIHELWPRNLGCVRENGTLFLNPCGLENFMIRLNKGNVVQIGPKSSQKFLDKAEAWHKKKWKYEFSKDGTIVNLQHGPMETEIDWYPWFDVEHMSCDSTSY